jgi:spermidine synthase
MCADNAPIVVGDGRLTLRQGAPDIDLLILDMFSSDSVPLHMLTREAFAMYRSRLSPDGVIAFNISNTNVQLSDVVAASAAANDMVTVVKRDGKAKGASRETLDFQAEIALVAQSSEGLDRLRLNRDWRVVTPAPGSRVWTDDYSNVLSAILNKMREKRP